MSGFAILGILFLLLLLNGLFSMAETAMVSSRRARLQNLADAGNYGARTAIRIYKQPTRFLSMIQIGITLIGILTGALSEDTFAGVLDFQLQRTGLSAEISHATALAIVVCFLTFVTLLVGELIPKRIALMYPEEIAAALAVPMNWMSRVVSPLIKILSLSTDAVLGLFRIRTPQETAVTTEELKVLIREGAEAGTIERMEQNIVSNVFRLADRRASALMTPRPDIVWLNMEAGEEHVKKQIQENPHAVYPVAQGSLDNVVGILNARECLSRALRGEELDVYALMRKALIVPESVSTLQLLEAFKNNPSPIALIADEYGSILGLVSQYDVLKSIVGELPTVEGDEEPNAVQREDGSWLVNGSMPADELKDLLKLNQLPRENEFDTVAGFFLMQLQRIPRTSDSFTWQDIRFEVMDMDGKRIDKVLVVLPPARESTGADE